MPLQAPSRRHALIGGFALLSGFDARGGLVEVIATAKRSVGAVGTFRAFDNPRFGFRGTGFVVGDGNSLVTNAHVLPEALGGERASTLAVQFISATGSIDPRSATVERTDAGHDLALLRFEGAAVPAFRIAEEKDIHEGLAVAFIGFPIGGVLGFRPVTHHGIISSITAVALPAANSQQLNEKTLRRLREGSFDIYQLDATAYPGNSGGPLLNVETGEVVGVVNMVLVKGTKESALSQPTGISYAVPARFVSDLIRGS
jgi:serine protease Do